MLHAGILEGPQLWEEPENWFQQESVTTGLPDPKTVSFLWEEGALCESAEREGSTGYSETGDSQPWLSIGWLPSRPCSLHI